MKRLVLATATALVLLVPNVAQASTIPYDCATCGSHNTSFDITYTLISAAENTYELKVLATYQPDDAGTPDYVYINAISMWLRDGDITLEYENGTPSLTTEPDGGPWNVVSGGLNSTGCSGGGTGFFCANSGGAGAAHGAAGDTDTWVFLIDLTGDTLLGDSITVHFKGHFVNASGGKVGSLISADFTATNENPGCGELRPCAPSVPEPASLLLMGGGLIAIAARLRRKAA